MFRLINKERKTCQHSFSNMEGERARWLISKSWIVLPNYKYKSRGHTYFGFMLYFVTKCLMVQWLIIISHISKLHILKILKQCVVKWIISAWFILIIELEVSWFISYILSVFVPHLLGQKIISLLGFVLLRVGYINLDWEHVGSVALHICMILFFLA